jgi:hypothetical protein
MNFKSFYNESSNPLTSTTEFKAWFNGSKIVDPQGNPLILYHGSHTSFNIFDKSKRGQSGTDASKKAFWFTSSHWNATNFSGGNENLVKAV